VDDHGDGVRLLAGGAPGGPDAKPLAFGSAGIEHLGQHLFLKNLQLWRIAIEAGLVGRNDLEELLHLAALASIKTKEIVIFVEVSEVEFLQPVSKPVLKQILTVVGNIYATLRIYEIPEILKLLIRDLEFLPKGDCL
jgi:hypothetical protein